MNNLWLPPSAFAKASADRRSFSGGWSGGRISAAPDFHLKVEATRKRNFPVVLLALLLLAFEVAGDGATPRQALEKKLRDVQQEAVALLKRAAGLASDSHEFKQLLISAADRLDSLAAGASSDPKQQLLTEDLVKALREAAATLRKDDPAASPSSIASLLELLDRVAARLQPDAGALPFQGSYSQTKVAEPVYGGHGSAMGPPPIDRRAAADAITSPVQFEEVPCIPTKTFCGGRTKDHILESGGSGVALFDFDGDGWLDVYVVNAFELSDAREKIPHRNALFKNLGAWKFQDVSSGSGVDVAAWGNGVCVGDYDDDGSPDLYVTNFGPNFLFRNNGDGTFADMAVKAGVEASGWSTGCTFFDADGDGDLDLYVARYVSASRADVPRAQRTLLWRGIAKTMVGPKGMPGEADLFFENRGNGTFVEATDTHGLTDSAKSYGFGVVATDYDDDGWVDLFVANDTNPNFLYRNRGDGRFDSVGLASGVALNADGRAQAGMGVDSGDYDGDGRLDLIITAFAHDQNSLYRNREGRLFDDVTAAVGLAGPTFERMGWGTAFADVDLDGDLDLLFANGHIYPNVDDYPELRESYRQKNQLFLNHGGRLIDVSDTAGSGLQIMKSSRGLAIGDLDNDGDPDVIITNMDDVPTVLENRQRTGHHWVAVQIEKAGRNRFAIGARVTITAAGARQVREIRSGGSYLSQSDLRAYYGLGSYSGPVDIEVRMPGGRKWNWRGQPTDRLIKLKIEHGQ
jgi:enediyne biosynthesis protein E4